MSYKTILLNLNEIAQVDRLLGVTSPIARASGAFVIGLYVLPAPDLIISGEIGVLPVEDDRQRGMFASREDAVRSAFGTAILKDGIEGEFRVVEASEAYITPTVVAHAHEADLVVIGHSSAESARAIGARFSEAVIMSSGRPTLVVPPDDHTVVSSSLAIIGWNGSREAARAVFDSVPLLKQSDEVLLAVVGPASESSGKNKMSESAARVARALARHDIEANIVEFATAEEAGNVLLTRAESRCASLLVVGAYGHSRLSEFILGGATRTVLKRMRGPVLFAH